MAQAEALIGALKNVLKARGITYAQLAKSLGLSEASVKRVFATKSFTLERFDQICTLLDIQISDLARMISHEAATPSQLSLEQENKLVSDPKLLLIAVHALNHWSLEEILEVFDFSKAECVLILARLDKLGIIDLMPNNRIRVRVAPDFTWLPGGPIQQYFRAQLRNDFFNSRFDRDGEKMTMVSGMLSRASNAIVQHHMRRLSAEFSALHHQDLSLPFSERFGTSLILAVRPWSPESFMNFQKKPHT
ncbi:DNA-binding transcriptional regulator, XRE family [Collimonas sp. OK242]|uniref:helix-turn-helix domain-containing protein n=1 Tax=Collimonas sp. OK242 TaxID=1798195 RepID=UPI0008947AF8|nr:helix-turn-helix transcriptional regulator [Collimonas sp. OK242]SDY47785.1 DNA-binding transcriptional regulator, XRE family [Collimonas sp. OK242]